MSLELPGLFLFMACLLFSKAFGVNKVSSAGIALPFEATYLISFGGFGINAFDAYLMFLIGDYIARSKFSIKKNNAIETSLILVLIFHALWVTIFSISMFSHHVEVSSLGGGQATKVGKGFLLTVGPLELTLSNFSQMFYLVFQMGAFLYFVFIARKYDTKVLIRLLELAFYSNLIMVFVDLAGLKFIQDWFFTAHYKNLQSASVHGFERVVGGFREAARQGQFSAVLFSLWLTYFLITGEKKAVYFFITSLLISVLSLSSTAFVCVGYGLLASILAALLATRESRNRALISLMSCFLVFSTISILMYMLSESFADIVGVVFNSLIFEKMNSSSGQERMALANIGMRVLQETYFLGAGMGSTRANGLISVWLANLGGVGFTLLLILIYICIFPLRKSVSFKEYGFASRVAFSTFLIACMISLTMPNVGQLFPIFAALCLCANERKLQS